MDCIQGVSKTLRGFCVFCIVRIGAGGFAPRIGTVQNTQGPSEFLTLPQFIPTFEPQPLSLIHI